MTEWISAVSLVVIAFTAASYVGLRISDEIRFRHAVTDVESQKDKDGPIIIPKRKNGGGGRRRADYRRRKAQNWIDEKIREAGDGR